MLIDTGFGRDGAPEPSGLAERLRLAGAEPAAISLVILSHADFDHVGGAVNDGGALAFPRARHILPRAEWDFWSARPERLPRRPGLEDDYRQFMAASPLPALARLRDQLELAEPGSQPAPGLRLLPAPGHTPGLNVAVLSSAGEQLWFISDLAGDEPETLEDPDWLCLYDFDQALGRESRRRLLARAAAERALLLGAHLPFPGLGHVVPHGPAYRWRAFGG